jgi:hypothetical protein
MTASPDPRRGDDPGSTGADATAELNSTRRRLDYAALVDCPIDCTIGRRSCPWECALLDEAA